MTKTITELQPMIYGDLLARTWERKRKQRRLAGILRKALWPAYVAAGLMIVFDAGAAPWEVSFWLIFLPFFLLGEVAAAAMTRSDQTARKDTAQSSNFTNWFAQFESSSMYKVSTVPLIDPVVARLEASKLKGKRADVLTADVVGV